MYEFLNTNNLISPNQSGFRPGASTINQLYLLLLTHTKHMEIMRKLERFFSIHLKHLTSYGMKVLSSN